MTDTTSSPNDGASDDEADLVLSGNKGADENLSSVGNRLRLRRKARRMTLAQIAAATGISIAQLSQIERGRSMPSINKLVVLCEALEMEMGWLFTPSFGNSKASEEDVVVRKARRRQYHYRQNNMLKELLTPDFVTGIQMMRMVLDVDGKTGDEPYNQPEGAKCGIVLRGSLALELDGVVYIIEEQDSFAFSATAMMRFWANGVETEILWVTSPAYY